MLCLNMNDIAIFIFKVVGYSWIIHGIIKSEAIPLLENSVLDDHGYIYIVHTQKVNIKSQIHNHYENLNEPE